MGITWPTNNSNEAGNESRAASAQHSFHPSIDSPTDAALDILSAVAGKAKDGSTEALIDDHIFKEMKRAHTSLSSHAACDTPKINDYVDELRLVAHGGILDASITPRDTNVVESIMSRIQKQADRRENDKTMHLLELGQYSFGLSKKLSKN